MALLTVVFVCTGNAARSVMAGAVLAPLAPQLRVATAGTLVIEGQPMSPRTRRALAGLGLAADGHRSRQLCADDLGAGLLVAFAAEHVHYVRRNHPEAASRTATLKRFVRDLPATHGPLPERVAALGLADVALEPDWEDVIDPAGGDDAVFEACAAEVAGLCRRLAAILSRRTV